MTGGREKSSVLADALEAVIGAVYLAGGLPRVMDLVDRHFGEALAGVARAATGWTTRRSCRRRPRSCCGRPRATG